MSAKLVLGGLAGIGLITTVSVVSSNRRGTSFDDSWAKTMPKIKFLSSDFDSSNEQKDKPRHKFGQKYRGLLVDYSSSDNEEWWKWSHENLKKDLDSKGESLEKTFKVENISTSAPDSIESLKNWCKGVYEVNTRSYEPLDYPSSLFNNSSVWKYCSPIQQSPISLQKSEVVYPRGTVGELVNPLLLDTNKNGRIWYYRNKLFEGIPKDVFLEGENPDAFVKGKKKGRKVQDICADAYKQTTEEFGIHDDVMFFCSISQLM